MKNKKVIAIVTLLCIMFTMAPVTAIADVTTTTTFEVVNEKNIPIKYSIISEAVDGQNGTVRVGISEADAEATKRGSETAKKHDPNTRAIADDASGEIIIPSVVEHDGKKYDVIEIGYCAFRERNKITKVVIPDSVKTLDHMAFSASAELVEVVVPDNITEMKTYMFANSVKLAKADFPTSTKITEVPDGTYSNTAIGNIVLGDHVTRIGGNAFANCPNLVLAKLPSNLSYVGYRAFYVNDQTYTDVMKRAITLTGPVELANQAFARSGFTSITILNLNSLGTWGFANSPNLGEVNLPLTVTTLPEGSFAGTKFQTYRIPNQVTSIESQSFLDCLDLTTLLVHSGVNTVEYDAFYGLADGSVVYVEDSELVSSLKGDTKRSSKDNTVHYHADKTMIAVTNGGIFDENTKFEAGNLATPIKNGYTAQWCTDEAMNTPLGDATPAAGATYYAKWLLKAPNDVKIEADTSIVTGSSVELTASAKHELDGVLQYQWYDGTEKIDGATDATYIATNLIEDTTFTCKVKAVNGIDVSEEVESSVTIKVAMAEGNIAIADDTMSATEGDAAKTFTYTATEGMKGITVSSSDEKVATATIDEATKTVTVTFVGAGTANITVAYAGGADFTTASDSITVTVAEKVIVPDTKPSTSTGGGFSGSYNYLVSTPQPDNGSVSLSDNNASAGETVTATVKPDNGYGVAEVIVTDEKGNVIPVTYLGGGEYSFVMPAGKVNIDVDMKPAIILTVGDKTANVFGKIVINDVAPIITPEGRTMLPIRFITEALGGEVEWNETAQTVTITKDGVTVQIIIGADYAYINGEKVKLDSPAFIANGRTYLPVRFVSEALGANVNWDAATQQVIIMN